MDEKLRLVVELQNRASAELRKLSKDFDSVRPTAGMIGTAHWFQQLEGVSTASTKAMRPLVGGLGVVGASGLAAGLSVAGLVQQFRELARAMPALQELSRQSGISKTELARLQYAASRLHLDPKQMTGAIAFMSSEMVEFSRRSGELYFEMSNGSAGLARKIASEWKDSPEEALKDIMGWLAAIPEASKAAGQSIQEGVQRQRHWTGKAFGDENFAQIFSKGMGGINAALDEAAQRVAPITDDLERAAEKFDNSITNLNTSWANIVRDLGPSFLDPLSHAIDHLDEVLKAGEKFFGQGQEPAPQRKPDGTAGESTLGYLGREFRNSTRYVLSGDSEMAKEGQWLWDKLFGVGSADAAERPGGVSDAARGLLPSIAPAAAPPPPAFHPSDDDRQTRARASDAPDRSLDSFVLGSLDKPVTHLVGTLKTAAAALDGNVRPAAFHPAAMGDAALGSDPVALLAAGTKAGFLAAFRELQGSAASGGTGGGFMPASFGGGGMGGGYSASAAGRRAPSIRFGRQHASAPFDDGGATPTGAHDPLKDLIAQHETGGTGAAGYDTVYGHAERGGPLAPPKPITQMTIGEVLAYQRAMKPRAGSPAFPVGRAQWTESTLRGLTRSMDPSTIFSPDVQEKLFDRSIAGRMGQGSTGFRSEWDSLRAVPDGEIERAMQGHREALASAPPTASASGSGVSSAAKGAFPAWMDDRSRREMAGINDPLARDLLAASEATGLHFRITQGLRTAEEAAHNALTGRGVFNSQHRWGAAADLVMQDAQGNDIRDRAAYKTFADAFAAHSRATGGNARWLGGLPGRWGSDIVHFDQGIGYGQTHVRDPYGAGGPTAADIAAGNREIFSGPDNPFLRAAHPIERAAGKLKDAVAPLPEIRDAPRASDAGGGQRVQVDPIALTIRHHPSGRTSVAAKAGRGVQISLRTAPMFGPDRSAENGWRTV